MKIIFKSRSWIHDSVLV